MNKNIEKLVAVSSAAQEIAKQTDSIKVTNVTDLTDVTFHPNGECGCIELDDDYFLDIRCNHLIWMDGNVEDKDWSKAVLVCGNHKWSMEARLITSTDSI
jgi:hypothetical protein